MRTISLGIPDVILDEIDKLVKENKVYGNRSDVLRQAIEELLSKELDYYKTRNR
ncbi:MAG: ribbon-helix-helix domain-containing protein [Candidatus Heimdallarchaeota archaeon]